MIKTIYRILKKKTIVGCREFQRTADVSCSLKQKTEGIWTRLSVFIGSWFHCGIVYGKNECLYVSLEVWICLYVRGWYFLVLVSETINMSDGTVTRWNDTLYIITNLVRSLRYASDGKFIILSISDTLLVLWYLLQMYRAARRWTISNVLMDSDVWGSQREQNKV